MDQPQYTLGPVLFGQQLYKLKHILRNGRALVLNERPKLVTEAGLLPNAMILGEAPPASETFSAGPPPNVLAEVVRIQRERGLRP
jgi:hypothetical protein